MDNIPKTFRLYGDKCHLVELLIDNDNKLIVYKKWRKHKQRWDYVCERLDIVKYLIDNGTR